MLDVDLVIPTYNRPNFLKRILEYYNSYRVPFKIIIADSSSAQNKKRNKQIAKSFRNLNILYLDKFSPNMVSHHKFAKMVKYVTAKFCVFCADDDFVVPNGIKDSVKFLEKNPDYSSAHGSYISFYLHTTLKGKRKFWWNFIYPYRSITSPDAAQRLIAHPIDCQQVLWSVRRTEVVKACYKELINSKTDPKLFGERLPDVLTVISGKMKRLNTFYGARQSFSTYYDYWPTEEDYIKEGTFDNKYQVFKNSIISVLKKLSNIPTDEASKIVDNNMKLYINSSSQQYIVAKLYFSLRHFPSFIPQLLRLLHAKYLFSKNKTDPRVGIISDPKSKYYKDFDRIRKLTLTNY